jgi:hypothetical protein
VSDPSPLAVQIAELDGALGDVADALIAVHVADPLGYCRACELPQGGPKRWPCTLWIVATTARAVLHSRLEAGDELARRRRTARG